MSTNPLNDISRVYLEQIVESAVPGKPAEKLGAVTAIPKDEQEAARQRTLAKAKAMREKKGIKEAAKPDYLDFDSDGNEKESMKKALKDKAKQKMEEAKKPNDGNLANNYPPYDKVTRGDVIAGRLGKDQMGGKKKVVKEGFSNWREDLREVMSSAEKADDGARITEKKVNNKIKTSAMGGGITLPEAVEGLGGTLVEMVELDEEFIYESADVATEYFYEQGLNEYGVDILIEDLGFDNFVDFVFEIVEEFNLNEARTLLGKKKNPQKLPKGTAPSQTTKAAVAKHGTTRKFASKPSSSVIKKKSVAVKKAVEKQPETKSSPQKTKTGIAGRIGAALGHAVARAKSDTALLKKSVDTARGVAARRGAEIKAVYDVAREKGKKAEQSPQATRARRKATVAAGRAAQAAGRTAVKAAGAAGAAAGAGVAAKRQGKTGAQIAGRAAGTFVRKMTKEELELQEKAESEQQQKLFGLALSVKRGQTPRSQASAEVLKIVDSMSEKKIRDFAKTKHEGIPKKVDEAFADITPMSSQELQATRQRASLDRRIASLRSQTLQKMKKPDASAQIQKAHYELEGEMIGEEDYDTMKDRHLERGGMGIRASQSPAKTGTSKPVDRQKQKETAQRALELVRQSVIAKHGKSSLM